MTHLEAYDPGLATGIASGYYDDVTPFTLLSARVVDPEWMYKDIWSWQHTAGVVRVMEGFRLRGSNNFTADLTGVELIGATKLMTRFHPGLELYWQMPTDKALVPDHILKEHGLWQTGKMVDHVDGRDANDAIIHALAFLFKQRHAPTIDKYFLEAD
jgi:hypothetical protein